VRMIARFAKRAPRAKGGALYFLQIQGFVRPIRSLTSDLAMKHGSCHRNNCRKKPAPPPTAVAAEHALKDFPWAGKKCHCERSFSPVFIAA
jgi:hypothetical protein